MLLNKDKLHKSIKNIYDRKSVKSSKMSKSVVDIKNSRTKIFTKKKNQSLVSFDFDKMNPGKC